MKNLSVRGAVLATVMSVSFAVPLTASAQMMNPLNSPAIQDSGLAQEEAAGKALWEKLQAKTVSCDQIIDSDFELMGEYFMSLMAGSRHATMNAMLIQRFGEEGEVQIHVDLGKRQSGCDASAGDTGNGWGFMSMMGGSRFNTDGRFGMMRGWSGGETALSWVSWGVWTLVGILAVVWLIRSILKK